MNVNDGQGEGDEFDVLGVYLETLRAQMSPQQFRALVRAVQATCGLLSEGRSAPLTVPGDGFLSSDLRREYLTVLSVMITAQGLSARLRAFRARGEQENAKRPSASSHTPQTGSA